MADPFVDPVSFDDNRASFAANSILSVGGGKASLTLATNELIVLGKLPWMMYKLRLSVYQQIANTWFLCRRGL